MALVAVILLGVAAMVGAITGNYVWMVPVVIGYVVWMFKRDGLPGQGRLPIGWYQHDRYLRARRWWRR